MALPSTEVVPSHNNVPFFLRNREFAGLVLDHCDYETIGTFRLLCKQALACVRISTDAYISERNTATVASELPSWYVRLDGLKAKIKHWETITFADYEGLVNFYKVFSVLAGSDEGLLGRVETVIFKSEFFRKGHQQVLSSHSSYFNFSKFLLLATYLKPRNVCIGSFGIEFDFQPLVEFMASWPLENVVWHARPLAFGTCCSLLQRVPHHHFFTEDSPYILGVYLEQYFAPEGRTSGLKTITFHGFNNRKSPSWEHTWYWGDDNLERQTKDSGVATDDVAVDGPGGVQYIFPANYEPCVYCNEPSDEDEDDEDEDDESEDDDIVWLETAPW